MNVVLLQGNEGPETYGQLADIHRQEIHEGFLSTLGPDFLSLLYESLARSESAFALVEKDGDMVQGFIVGAMDTGAVYKEFFRKAGARALPVLLPKLLSPARVRRVFETLLYPKSKSSDGLPEPEILNFCVRSELQGKGVGSRLFEALCAEFGRRGVTQIRIVTGAGQKSAQVFYQAKGATLAANVQVHKDSQSLVYVYDIEPGVP